MYSRKNSIIIIVTLTILLSNILVVFSQNTKAIKFKGIKKNNISFLRKLLKTRVGNPLDSVELEKDIILLKRLPSISHAYYAVNSHKNEYEVVITVDENFTIIPDVNIWETTGNRTAYKIGITEFNFLGRSINVGGFYQNNGHDTYGFHITAPYLFSRNLGLSLSYQNWKSEEPLYFDDNSANYFYNNKSFEVLGLFQLNFKNRFQLGVNFFEEHYRYIKGFTAPEVPRRIDVDKFLTKFVYTYDNLDYNYYLVKGFKSEFYGQHVINKSNPNDDFLIFWNDFLYYKLVGKRGNWANRFRVGFSSNKDSPFAPFALDNNLNVRGVGVLVDRGTGTIVYNTEYRHTLIEKKWFVLQGNAFFDMKFLRMPAGNLNNFFKSENSHFFSGLGLRFMHKNIYNAIFRIDYGVNLQNGKGGLVFGLGQYF